MSSKSRVGACLAACLMWLAGCGSGQEASHSIPDDTWAYNTPVELTLDVQDTTRVYKLAVLLTLNDEYPFRNLWVRARLTHPNAPAQEALTEFLFMDELGNWSAERSMRGQYAYEATLADSIRLPATGTWQVTLTQMMRQDKLPGMLSVGAALR